MDINKIAIVGFGSIGKRHFSVLKKLYPDLEIVLVRSSKSKNGRQEEEADAVVYSIKDALDLGIQAAIIASPATFHSIQAHEFAENGVHLLIEKPLSFQLDGLEELGEIISEKKIVCHVGYVLRYDPNLLALKNFIESNNIGNILNIKIQSSSYLPDWRPGQDYKTSVSAQKQLGGGVLLELSHELDYSWLFSNPKKSQVVYIIRVLLVLMLRIWFKFYLIQMMGIQLILI